MDTSFNLARSPRIAAPVGQTPPHEHQATSAVKTLLIRKLQWADITAASEVISDSFQIGTAFGGWLQPLFKIGICEDFRSRLQLAESGQAQCFVASISNTVVGVIEISARALFSHPTAAQRYAYISNLAVDNDYRRLGIGQKLISQCEEIAKGWGFTDIYLHVMANNQAGQQLYLKLGFEIVSSDWTWHILPWQKTERLFLRKHL